MEDRKRFEPAFLFKAKNHLQTEFFENGEGEGGR